MLGFAEAGGSWFVAVGGTFRILVCPEGQKRQKHLGQNLPTALQDGNLSHIYFDLINII